VSAAEVSPLNRLLTFAPVARCREVALAASSRWHVLRLDRCRDDRAQLRALLGLVHTARSTPFGREHDFSRIRSIEDFRRLVPVRTPAELARAYPGPGQTWPGAHSDRLLTSHRQAMRTALAFALNARPRTRPLAGPILWLGNDSDESALRRFPLLVRPGVRMPSAVSGRAAPRILVGPASQVADFLLESSTADQASNPCRDLVAVLCARNQEVPVEDLRPFLGPRVLLLEMLALPEGPVAVTDPRHGALRLLADHGTYLEFIPADESGQRQPARLAMGELRTGVAYEVALTSPAGWWACRSGLVVAFERLAPPLLRVVEVRSPSADELAPVTVRPSHRQSAGSPAALRETLDRIPWSVPVDRG
jgi:hypothetical protein